MGVVEASCLERKCALVRPSFERLLYLDSGLDVSLGLNLWVWCVRARSCLQVRFSCDVSPIVGYGAAVR